MKEYAKKKNKLTHEIVDLEEKYRKERKAKYPEYEKDDIKVLSTSSSKHYDDKLVQELVKVIEEFHPIKQFKNEELYHTNLYTYLCEKIPGTIGFEEQRGRSRPDIIVGDIAIEVKGPTNNQGLITIADKINRYSQHFDYILVVLFEIEVYEKFYQEWYESIMSHYEDQVTIIRKSDVMAPNKPIPASTKESSNKNSGVQLPKQVGYCIRCGVTVPLDQNKPLCQKCYLLWVKYSNKRYPEKYCHICGTQSKQFYNKPVCYNCWKKLHS